MHKLERYKPYKNSSPMATVQLIRNILADNDIFVIESAHKKEPVTGVCSCRIILGDEGLRELNIGSNGKGMDARYALASAYGEFMERLQNGATLWKTLGIPRSVPEAAVVSKEEYHSAITKLMQFAFGPAKDVQNIVSEITEYADDYSVITFMEYPRGEELMFPAALYNRMTGSNGMAAGNTISEAIIQGLSEVFERAALQHLFLTPITPPTINDEYFENTDVLKRLKRLSNKGIKHRILDCSLNQGLPVIGLLIEKSGNFHLHFGADPSPITALERCLTEIFQGRTIEELPLYPPLQETEDRGVLFRNEEKEYTDSTGQVPMWIIDGVPSYRFSDFPHPITISDSDDIAYYIDILTKLGKKLYVRDCSYLGFPAVRIYVPGMTENHCPLPDYCLERRIPEVIRNDLMRLPKLSDKEFESLSSEIRAWIASSFGMANVSEVPSHNFANFGQALPAGTFPGRFWADRLTLAAIYLRGGLIDDGHALLNRYIDESHLSVKEAELLRLRLCSRSLTFVPTEWPQCPDCSKCRARHLCFNESVTGFNDKLTQLLHVPH